MSLSVTAVISRIRKFPLKRARRAPKDVYKRQGPNVAGVIGTAVAAGTFMAIFGV